MSFDLGSQDLLKAIGCMVLSGPFLTGYTQVRSGQAYISCIRRLGLSLIHPLLKKKWS